MNLVHPLLVPAVIWITMLSSKLAISYCLSKPSALLGCNRVYNRFGLEPEKYEEKIKKKIKRKSKRKLNFKKIKKYV